MTCMVRSEMHLAIASSSTGAGLGRRLFPHTSLRGTYRIPVPNVRNCNKQARSSGSVNMASSLEHTKTVVSRGAILWGDT
jgi:hypothetical protein